MATRMQQRRGTAAQWISTHNGDGPILNPGELGFETDTGKFKIGDGVNHWVDLDYFLDESEINNITGDYVLSSTLAQANGVATLDGSGKLTSSQIPSTLATETYVNTAVSNLIDSAPGALDTLNELAAALNDDSNFSTTVSNSIALKAPLESPTFTGTVSGVTASMVGLGNVDNTSDANKPVSTATQSALDLKAPLESPTFTGTVTLPQGSLVSANSTSNAFEIRQTGTGNALVVEDSTNPDASPTVIDANGQIIRGNTTWTNIGLLTAGIQTSNNSGTEYGGLGLIGWRNNTALPAALHFAKSNSSAVGTQAAVASGTDLGRIAFFGSDGTDFKNAAMLLGEADATPSTDIVPGRLTFHTTDSAGTSTERMRITSAGLLGIGGTPSGAMVQIFNNTAANVGLIVKGNASQSGALQQWQNSSGTTLASVNSAGQFVGDGSQLTGIAAGVDEIMVIMGAL